MFKYWFTEISITTLYPEAVRVLNLGLSDAILFINTCNSLIQIIYIITKVYIFKIYFIFYTLILLISLDPAYYTVYIYIQCILYIYNVS